MGIAFDRTDDFVTSAINNRPTNSWSVFALVTVGSVLAGGYTIISDWNYNSGASQGFSFYWNADDLQAVSGDGVGFNAGSWLNKLSAGSSYFLGVVVNAGTCKFFVNGSSGSTDSSTDSSIVYTVAPGQYIGAESGGNRLLGTIHEIAMWNYAIQDSQMLNLMNSKIKGLSIQIPSPNFVLTMNNGESGTSADGDIIVDLMGLNNGTGNDGAGGTGLTWTEEKILSYPPQVIQ